MSEEQINEAQENAEEQVDAQAESQTETTQELSEVEQLQAEIEKLQAEVAETKDQALRVQAEAQNIRRRAEADVEKAHKFGQEKFAQEVLTVLDNLERALAAAPEDEATKAICEGVEMTHQGLVSSLEKFQVTAIDPQGEAFNPEHHQAMSMVENAEVPPNTVIAVMQKGYTLHGRLLRPAMVMVSKGAPSIDETA